MEIIELKLYRELKNRESKFLPKIDEISNKANSYLVNINALFPHYTLHDIEHSFRVADYAFDLVSEIAELSDLELTLMIVVSLLHDIGMYMPEDEIDKIKDIIEKHSDYSYESLCDKFQGDKKQIAQYYVRVTHAERSKNLIKEVFNDYLCLPLQDALNYAEDTALICESHNKNYEWISSNLLMHKEKGEYSYNPQYIALLLRLADLLDFDSQRAPLVFFDTIKPHGFSEEEWQKHLVIDNSIKIKSDENQMKKIEFLGECNNIRIHRRVIDYINFVNEEVFFSKKKSEIFPKKYLLKLYYPITNGIIPKGFNFSDLKLNLDFSTVSNLIMGESIYGEKKYGLREIIQNGIDSCRLLKILKDTKKNIEDDEYEPIIKVVLKEDKNEVIIKDNGTGMNFDILKSNFLNIGKSYYKSEKFLLSKNKFNAIGRFGIGFLSCFMLSNEIKVKTRYYDEESKITLDLEKENPYLGIKEEKDLNFQGTEIILNYKEFMTCFGNDEQILYDFIHDTFILDDIKIYLINKSEKKLITNKIEFENDKAHLEVENYLEDIYGYIELNYRPSFLRTFRDFQEIANRHMDNTHIEEYYLYENNTLKKLSDVTINIKDILTSDKIIWTDFTVVSKDELEKYKELLNRELYSFDLREKHKGVRVFIKSQEILFVEEDFSIFGYGEIGSVETKVIENKNQLFYDEFIKNIKSIDDIFIDVYSMRAEILKVFGNTTNLLHSFQSNFSQRIGDKKFNYAYYNDILLNNEETNEIILVPGIKVRCYKINIKNNKLTPHVSRLSLDRQSSSLLDEALNIVVLMNAYESLSVEEEKECLKDFIKTTFKKNTLIKKEKLDFFFD